MNLFKRSTPGTLFRVFGEYRPQLWVLFVLGVIGAVLESIGIGAAIPLLSFLMGGGEPTDIVSRIFAATFEFLSIPFTFRYLLGAIVVVFLVRACALVASRYVRGRITASFIYKESSTLFEGILLSRWSFLTHQNAGQVQTALTRNVQRSRDLLEAVSQAIQSITGAVIYFIVAFTISPVITSGTILAGMVFLFFLRPLTIRLRRLSEAAAATEKKFAQHVSEYYSGIKMVKAAGGEGAALERARNILAYLRTTAVRVAIVRGLNSSFVQPFGLIFIVIMFAITYNTAAFSIPTFAAALYLIQKIFVYLESSQVSLQNINEFLPYAENSLAYKQELSRNAELPSGDTPLSFEKSIEFSHVAFAHGDTTVLSDISFSIPKGQIVGLVGPSGAGKTTVADLLLRLNEPKSGSITVDGIPLSAIRTNDWRTAVSYVPQDIFLLNDTIEENIRLYEPSITTQAITAAAQKANIHEFIETLPEGYQTVVGERGILLSGGQRQRIALARALVRTPQILILDEATSALDAESERLIHDSLYALRGSLTMLVIAHRLSTIEAADHIVVLEKGVVREVGSPQALRERADSYLSRVQNAT